MLQIWSRDGNILVKVSIVYGAIGFDFQDKIER